MTDQLKVYVARHGEVRVESGQGFTVHLSIEGARNLAFALLEMASQAERR